MKKQKTIRFLFLYLVIANCSFSQSSLKKNDSLALIALTKEKVYLFVKKCWETPIPIPTNTILLIYNTDKCSHDTNLAFYNIIYQGSKYIVDTADVLVQKGLYKKITNMSELQKDSLYSVAIKTDSTITALKQKIRDEQIKNELKEAEKQGVIIMDANLFDMSEYTDGTGFTFKVYNPEGKKSIKYITLKVIGYNPVNDKVFSSKFNSYVATLKGVGPIKPGESGTYSWDYVWFTDLPVSSKVVSVIIQYMDGTFKTITNPSKVLISDDTKEYFNLDQ